MGLPDTQIVQTYCPSLEHLVLPPGSPHPTFHPTITWVDLWSPYNNQQERYKALRDSLPAAFPSLLGIRQLDAALRSLPDLPSMLHETINDGSDFEYDFPGISIIFSFGNFIKKEMMYLDYEEYEEYEKPSDDEGSESDGYVGRHWTRSRRWETRSYDATNDLYDDTSEPWYTDESSLDESEGSDDMM
jgi:hypothetical protein